MTDWKPGDQAMFFGWIYTLIEPSARFGWLAVRTGYPHSKPRIILTEYLRRVPSPSDTRSPA